MDISWLDTTWTAILMVVITTIGIYISLVILTRLVGLRSFSKMSSFDIAITIAIGSLIANTILNANPPLPQAVVALAVLYLLQITMGLVRNKFPVMRKLVDNEPLLLMRGAEMLDENLTKAQVTPADVRAKLRQANVTQFSQVKAVVMEATGEISVISNNDPDHEVDSELLQMVRGWDDS